MATTQRLGLPAPVEELLDRITSASWAGMEQHLTDDVLYDASVPGWRYQYRGRDRVLQEYRDEWTGTYRWTVVELDAVVDGDGAFVLIEMHGVPRDGDGDPVVCRLSNLFRLEDGRIASHRYTCCGEWDPKTVQHIAAHAPMVEGMAR